MSKATFVDACLAGDALLSDIDDYVTRWHVSKTDVPLSRFLGLTQDEYFLWVEKPWSLRFIIAHRSGIPGRRGYDDEENVDLCPNCSGYGCAECQGTGYNGGREP